MTTLAPIAAADLAAVLALNNRFARETSELTRDDLAALLDAAFFARRIGSAPDAFLIAFDQDAAYASPNFTWFKARYERFVYVDRVVVAPHARRRGLARACYEALFAAAAAAGQTRVGCEVNVEPVNPDSDAFHAALGFEPLARRALANGKTVRYLMKGALVLRGEGRIA